MDINGIFADNIEVTPSGGGSLEIDLEGVDLSQLISELGVQAGVHEILDEIPREEIREYLNDKDKEDAED